MVSKLSNKSGKPSKKEPSLAASTLASARRRFNASRPLLETRNAQAFQAHDSETGSTVTFWTLRFPVQESSPEGSIIKDHFARILECPISCPGLIAYGVDRKNLGFYVTEKTRGKPLSRKRIDPEMIAIIFSGMLEQVAAVHSRGLASGTLCEDSFLVDAALGVSLVGLFPALPKAESQKKIKLLDSIHSSIAPEQRVGKNGSKASDVFALGALLYRMLAKRSLPATVGENQHFEHLRTLGSTIFQTHPQLAWMQPALEKSLRWKPENRFANADEFLKELKKRRPKSDSDFIRKARIVEAVVTEYLLSPAAKIASISTIVLILMILSYNRSREKLKFDTAYYQTQPAASGQVSRNVANVRDIGSLNVKKSSDRKKKSFWDYVDEVGEESADSEDWGEMIGFGKQAGLSTDDSGSRDDTDSIQNERPEGSVRTATQSKSTKSLKSPKGRRSFRRFSRDKSPKQIRAAEKILAMHNKTATRDSWTKPGSAFENVLIYGSVVAPKSKRSCSVKRARLRRAVLRRKRR